MIVLRCDKCQRELVHPKDLVESLRVLAGDDAALVMDLCETCAVQVKRSFEEGGQAFHVIDSRTGETLEQREEVTRDESKKDS